ncbi:hypothetical protein QAD02_015728 [Eretmocerus hayati]|uniref:Uncharacterized protein n=1 Tax=Eretmocerus hayati TaxID=131215 RepID=A0ACC2P924_9HYME|nr:hypothetical protein QAD02_015728 [Eretmocerus hayati]
MLNREVFDRFVELFRVSFDPEVDENRNNYGDSYSRIRNQNRTAVFCYLNDTQITQGAAFPGHITTRFRADYLKNKLDLCTHLVFGAAYVTYEGNVRPFNPDRLTDQSGDGLSFNELGNLKSQRPGLEIILSIAGDPTVYSQVARQRQNFVTQIRNLMNLYKFDGVNIDWRYPGRREDPDQDRKNFKDMIRDLRTMLRGEGKSLMASITHQSQGLRDGYDFTNDLLEHVDYWLIMAFEYFNHQSNKIGANAPIRSKEPFGVEKSIYELKNKFGEHSFRLILAVPFYGKQYQLRNRLSRDYESPLGKDFINNHAPAESVMFPYREICKKLNSNHWRQGYDSDAGTAYAVHETSAIVYDDTESVRAKVRLALQNGLGGVMAYSVDMDDYTGSCSQQDRCQQFPLLQAMHDAVQRGSSSSLAPSRISLLMAILFTVALIKMRS